MCLLDIILSLYPLNPTFLILVELTGRTQYESKRYGSTRGKGLLHKAGVNATADVQQPRAKYLLDMPCFNDWVNTAKNDADMALVGACIIYFAVRLALF